MSTLEECSFDEVCKLAFDEDTVAAFNASIELARRCGVPEELVLKSVSDINKYFTE